MGSLFLLKKALLAKKKHGLVANVLHALKYKHLKHLTSIFLVDSHRNSGQAAFLAHTSLQGFSGESSTSCNQCKQNWNVKYLREPRANEDVKNSVGDEDKKRQRLAATCGCVCIFNVNQAMGTCSSTTKTTQIKSNEESLLNQRSKRIRKGRHRSTIHQHDNLVSHVQTITEQQVPEAAANKNTFSCLTVDEGIGDTMTIRHKVRCQSYSISTAPFISCS